MKKILRTSYVNDTVLDLLRRDGMYICADCGGRGHCGKCGIRFTSPEAAPEPLDCDRKFFAEEELESGWRLACTAVIGGGAPESGTHHEAEVEIPERIVIKDTGGSKPGKESSAAGLPVPSPSEIIAVDYGIMSLSGALVDLNSGVVSEAGQVNHLRAYGRNIKPRLKSAVNGYSEEMRRVAAEDIKALAASLGRDPERSRFIISGGTAAQHLISGFSCKGLITKPYEPVDMALRRDGSMTMLPCAGAFEGARLISGICSSGLDNADKPFLYLDIDATIEMAIGNGDSIFVSHTKWGPRDTNPGITWKEKDVERIRDDIRRFIQKAGVDPYFMDNVVLSGDFEGIMSFDDVASSGILPEGLESKVSSAGNASLAGAVLYALDTGFGARLTMLAEKSLKVLL